MKLDFTPAEKSNHHNKKSDICAEVDAVGKAKTTVEEVKRRQRAEAQKKRKTVLTPNCWKNNKNSPRSGVMKHRTGGCEQCPIWLVPLLRALNSWSAPSLA